MALVGTAHAATQTELPAMPELDGAQAAVMVRFLQSMEPLVQSALDANLACDICAEELDGVPWHGPRGNECFGPPPAPK